MGITKNLPDIEIAYRYKKGDNMTDMAAEYKVTSETLRRHIKKKGMTMNRKVSIPWTEEEENTLIEGHNKGLTGCELWDLVPTRTHVATKGHVKKLYEQKRIGHNRFIR